MPGRRRRPRPAHAACSNSSKASRSPAQTSALSGFTGGLLMVTTPMSSAMRVCVTGPAGCSAMVLLLILRGGACGRPRPVSVTTVSARPGGNVSRAPRRRPPSAARPATRAKARARSRPACVSRRRRSRPAASPSHRPRRRSRPDARGARPSGCPHADRAPRRAPARLPCRPRCRPSSARRRPPCRPWTGQSRRPA